MPAWRVLVEKAKVGGLRPRCCGVDRVPPWFSHLVEGEFQPQTTHSTQWVVFLRFKGQPVHPARLSSGYPVGSGIGFMRNRGIMESGLHGGVGIMEVEIMGVWALWGLELWGLGIMGVSAS